MRNRKAVKRACARIDPLIEHWIACLGLGDWRVTINLVSDRAQFAVGDGIHEALFRARPQWEYKQAVIDANARRVLEIDDDYLVYAFVHELVHLLLAEISRGQKRGHLERVTTEVANALLRAAGE